MRRTIGFALALVAACGGSTEGKGGGARDAAADVADGSAETDAGVQDIANGEPCVRSTQCRGGCCELHGNTTVCAQIAPFDTSQSCACAEDAECAAVKVCGQPGFCQEPNQVTSQRFCSRVCR